MARILIVEDDAPTAELVKTVLESAGHTINSAGNGLEAIRLIKTDKPELVLMDVMMPVMNGFQALSILKNDPETDQVPVVMLTARSGDLDMAHGWAEGVDFYLTKPFSPTELITVVERILPTDGASA